MFSWKVLALLLAALAALIAITPPECPPPNEAQASVRKPGDPPVKPITQQAPNKHAGDGVNAFKKAVPLLLVTRDKAVCFAVRVERNQGLVGLLLTGFLVAFTYLLAKTTGRLWRSTRKVARAADKSARAAVASEEARFHIVIDEHNFPDVLKGAIMYPNSPDDSTVTTKPAVRYSFKNFGKTPGIIKEVHTGTIVCEAEPPIPVYSLANKELTAYMIPHQGETELETAKFNDTLYFGTTKEILSGELSLWFYGKLIYEDVFGNEHWHRFYWRFNGNRPFQPYDHKHYNDSF